MSGRIPLKVDLQPHAVHPVVEDVGLAYPSVFDADEKAFSYFKTEDFPNMIRPWIFCVPAGGGSLLVEQYEVHVGREFAALFSFELF